MGVPKDPPGPNITGLRFPSLLFQASPTVQAGWCVTGTFDCNFDSPGQSHMFAQFE